MASWTDARVDLLTELWGQGLSAAECAKQLGGVSRNGALGKLHRLGLLGTRKPPSVPRVPGEQKRPRVRAQAKVFGETRVKPAAAAPRAEPVDLEHLFVALSGSTPRLWTERESGHCAWPIGDLHACCEPIFKRNWCARHHATGTQPMKAQHTAKAYERRFAA
jgi:hypothetical protein